MPRPAYLAAGLWLAAIAPAAPRGYLTTATELARVRERASAGVEPYRSAVRDTLAFAANARLPAPDRGRTTCSASRQPVYATSGGPAVYSYALAYHLTQETAWAVRVREAIRNLQSLTSLDAGDCPLTMGRHIPDWIRAADLIDDQWDAAGKRAFQDWLATVIYPSLATKYRRGNNWGAVITNAGQYIADYLNDRTDLKLDGRSPAAAYALMRQTALDRVNGLIWDQCGQGVSMIRPDGGIPEEIRRSTTCGDTHIEAGSAAHHYLEGYLAANISQAELCLRRGDRSLYDNRNATGGGSIHQAIDFVLDRVVWDRQPTLIIAARYYRDPRLLSAARRPVPAQSETRDYINQFTALTHSFAEDETPEPPPVVAPPK